MTAAAGMEINATTAVAAIPSTAATAAGMTLRTTVSASSSMSVPIRSSTAPLRSLPAGPPVSRAYTCVRTVAAPRSAIS
ncbi:Uncharacterised protein [Mycobacteroides abscessus subsp. abscessus]|nr:Uncharacterised protein [Mycobacteroides abscessus subsp. abscessus]SHX54321.1 Uncharacterised protein [Mycobacteroides abscessus subsp. abscessus]SKP82495.1 Uncharacterised protein [Mycobacteroides abscessus subsp. abscessus]